MKKLLLAAAVILTMSSSLFAEGDKPGKLKKHHCTAACTKEKHAYAHGEKGHVCTDACKKAKA